ncbi:hypothetical protein ACLB2K_066246 [Fragaria x ananassa]
MDMAPRKKTASSSPIRIGGDFSFVLVNPEDAHSSTKSYLQEVLNMYIRELPAMNFAANTGKHSMFLERCVTNGKYCTLLLQSRSVSHSEEIIAAITYQIVPADTQYAEIPIAAVSSMAVVSVTNVLANVNMTAQLHPNTTSSFLYHHLMKPLTVHAN